MQPNIINAIEPFAGGHPYGRGNVRGYRKLYSSCIV